MLEKETLGEAICRLVEIFLDIKEEMESNQ